MDWKASGRRGIIDQFVKEKRNLATVVPWTTRSCRMKDHKTKNRAPASEILEHSPIRKKARTDLRILFTDIPQAPSIAETSPASVSGLLAHSGRGSADTTIVSRMPAVSCYILGTSLHVQAIYIISDATKRTDGSPLCHVEQY